MKYTTALLAFAAGALAQSSAVTTAPATTSVPEVSPAISCVSACTPGDVTCQASCLGIARPNSSQAVETTECAAKCDQGDGSAEATQKYSDCVQSCIASLFPSSQTGSQIPGGAAASSAAATRSGANPTNPTASTGASAGSTASQTGSGSASPQATGAANFISAQIGGVGLAGLLAAFAL
ncbi:hypothetical protein BU25DRAFT_421458 [Macroventuria anomochaeta]|uniref:Uncharacterized protein n=1 Tax=Macroventuria anomochaeta TaxID=301207 RepID=A0ACB6S1Q5_9PLEO|nr:uncharacterized protein BU25DRAFT_421458 [Macroventuria anomochaeta]KAF2627964.1 hypothetical protein BU25DRAFT_421458 [Macroventuria anomochaeta]